MYLSSKITTTVDIHFTSLERSTEYRPANYVFLLVQLGAIRVAWEDDSVILSENDILLLRPDQEYQLTSISQNRIARLELGRDFLDSRLQPDMVPVINTVTSAQASDQDLHQILTGIMLYYEDPRHESLLISYIWQLLDQILTHYITNLAPEQASKEYVERRINSIKNLIEQNYFQQITLPELAEKLFLTPQYLSKFIRVHMGTTFNHYLNDVRISHAYDALEQSGATITEIALDNGFPSSAAFSSQFARRHGLTPSAWRKQHRQADSGKNPLLAEQSHETVLPKSAEADYITIRTDRGTPYQKSWTDTINIGQLSNALSTSFEESFTRAQAQAQFRYVRFYNLFDDNLILPASKNPSTYNFYHLDTIFDYFRNIHILPFIDISYKPPKAGSRKNPLFDHPDLFGKKKPLEEELQILDALLRHFINRYGRTEVSRWRFEIWAPHINILEYTETPAEYWARFDRIRNVIKGLLPDAAVGGPGYNVTAGSRHFEDLMAELRKLPFRPDYLSIYMYCFEATLIDSNTPESQYNQFRLLTMDPNYPIRTLREYIRLASRILEKPLPMYITEFNSGLLTESYLCASAYQAAFLMKQFIALSAETPCIGYWHFSDITDEAVMLDRGFPIGMGLVNYIGIPNPSWFVYELMSHLGPLHFLSSDSLMVCGTKNKRISLVTCNYVHYTRNFCFSYMQPRGLNETYLAVEPGEPKKKIFRFDNLANGNYAAVIYRVGRKCGSILDLLIEIYNSCLDQGIDQKVLFQYNQMYEVSNMRQLIHPQVETRVLNCKEHSLTLELELDPMDIVCVKLEPLF